MQYVVVAAWVPGPPGAPDQGLPGQPPGIWGGAPSYPDQGLPPSGVGTWPGQGRPDQGLPPSGIGVWPGPGRPDQGLPGQPPGIWGGAPSYPDQGLPPSGIGIWPGGGSPSHPIAPGGPPPGIWPGPGRPDQGLPPSGVGIWPGGGQPSHPIVVPPESEMPQHPELPDLNAGNWMYAMSADMAYKAAFIPWPLAVTHPDYKPVYPEQGLPGEWQIVVYNGRATWAWIPSEDSGDQPTPTPHKADKAK